MAEKKKVSTKKAATKTTKKASAKKEVKAPAKKTVKTEVKKANITYYDADIYDVLNETNKMYDFITIADKIEIDYAMKMIQKFDLETIKHISEKFSQYYTNSQLRIKDTRYLITLVLGIINESTNSES